MTDRRPPKKSAMLEVRLSHEAKEALMARCRAEGVSASEFVRANIERFLQDGGAAAEPATASKPPRPNRFAMFLDQVMDMASAPRAALAAVGIAAGMMVAVNPSIATPDLQAMFERFDSDADGTLSPAEFDVAALDDRFVFNANPEPVAVPMPCPDVDVDVDGADVDVDVNLELEGAAFDTEQAAFEAEMEAFDRQAEQFAVQAEQMAAQMMAQEARFQNVGFTAEQRAEIDAHAAAMAREAARMEAQADRIAERARAHAERQAAHAQAMAARQAARVDHAAIHAQARQAQAQALAASFDRLDRNSDERLTAEDFRGGNVEMIQHLDRNNDGVITRSEFQCP